MLITDNGDDDDHLSNVESESAMAGREASDDTNLGMKSDGARIAGEGRLLSWLVVF
jgi:hypothetical protein